MAKSKLTAAHTTFIPMAEAIKKFATKLDEVTRISSGVIIVASRGLACVKITDGGGAILLQVRAPGAVQDVRIYTKDHTKTVDAIRDFCFSKGWKVRENID